MRTAFIESLVELARHDPKVWLLTADLGYSVLERFRDEFPDRYVNVGVAEQNMVGIAAGLALSGCKVFVFSIGNFPTQRCLEQIRVDVCYHGAHVIVVAVGGGFAYGSQGYTHHAIEDLAVMRSLPGMRVVAPADPLEASALVKYLAEIPGPGYLRLGRAGEAVLHDGPMIEPPLAPVQLRKGFDVVLVATGNITVEVLAAADMLASRGFNPRVISASMLKPFDGVAFWRLVEDARLIVAVEEHSKIGGLRDTIAPVLVERAAHPRLVALGVEDGATLGVVRGQDAMRRHCGIDASSIASCVEREYAKLP